MLSKIYKLILIAFVLISCLPGAPTETSLSKEDTLNTAVASIIQTQTAAPSPTPTIASLITVQPTTTQTGDSEHFEGQELAWNYLATQDSGGVLITIGRVVLADPAFVHLDFSTFPIFNNKSVLVEIIFIIENNTADIVTVYPDQGLVRAGGEQIELFDYATNGGNILGGSYSGDVLPGTKLIGGLWIGLQRATLNEVNSMTIYFSAPQDKAFNVMGPDYNFVLDLSKKQFSPIPQELKSNQQIQ